MKPEDAFLSERKKSILKAIVDAHIENGEPVGSKYLTQGGRFSYSSATIRNEMAELERRGLIHSIITRRVFGLPESAGCRNVINLHGSVYENYCQRCGRKYPVEYIRNSKRVPLCENCNTTIRPKVCLFGEMVDNQVITRAAREVQKADVLLVLGTNLKTNLCSQLVQYYEGTKLILVNAAPHYADRYADLLINERVDDTLEKIIKELG